MITQKDILADFHTHTTASKHAYSTLYENVKSAEKAGMTAIAITDHFWGDGTELDRRNELARIQHMARCNKTIDAPVTVIPSAEFNLGQRLSEEAIQRLPMLKYRPIGLHGWFYAIPSSSFQDFFHLWNVAANAGFNVFAHPEREMHKLLFGFGENHFDDCVEELEKVVDLAVDRDILLEVNESTLVDNDGGAADRLKAWLAYAKTRNARIVLGSDAHICCEVGVFLNTIELLSDLDYPKELIVNCNESMIHEYF